MATVLPFCCIRPREDIACRTAALPYDVYGRREAREAAARDALSFLNIDRPETQFPADADMYSDEVYAKAGELLEARMADGTYIEDGQKCYYVYELIMDGRHQTGIAACASIDDYLSNMIKKHENTREEKERDRIRHVDACNAQTGPIFLAYRSSDVIAEAVRRAKETKKLYGFTSEDGITHNVWRIADQAQQDIIRDGFAAVDSIYIADGHHRAASAVRVGLKRRAEHPDYDGTEEFNYFLSVLFPEEELMILPYNRVVRDLNGLTQEEFLARTSERFAVEQLGKEPCRPERKGTFGMYLDGCWYRLTAGAAPRSGCRATEELTAGECAAALSESVNQACAERGKTQDSLPARAAKPGCSPVESLDVSVLQRELLSPVLGIGDPRVDKRIDFVGGIRGTKELERRAESDMRVAFCMYPTTIAELFAVADAGLLMPPKSTWFEPKLRSGLFIHSLGQR